MPVRSHQLILSILLLSLPGTVGAAEGPVLHHFKHLAIAPAGDRLASVEADDISGQVSDPHGKVVLRDRRNGHIIATLDPCPTCKYSDIAFSPRKQVAFLASDEAKGAVALYVGAGDNVREVTSLNGVANSISWSPDGQSLAMLITLNARKKIGAVEAGAPQVGEIGVSEDEQRIAIVDPVGGSMRLVSPADTFIYEYDWTPDGKAFVATAAKGNGDNEWWVAHLDYIDARTGATRAVAAPKMQMDLPRVSPDGKTVAFVGGLMSDFGSVGGDIYTVPLTGGIPTDITPQYAGSFNSLAWRGGKLVAGALVGPNMAITLVDPFGRSKPQLIWSQPLKLNASEYERLAIDGRGANIATIAEDFAHGPHILAGPLAKPVKITDNNDTLINAITAKNISWTNEGYNVQGWLLAPVKIEPGKTYPMVVIVHGGPGAAAEPQFIAPGEYYSPSASVGGAIARDLTSRGYYVFMPNPRGSFGQGDAFTRANIRDFGGGDLRDIIAGIDAAAAQAPIDSQRVGMYGHSYGGFMTMFTVTHSQRFKAAVAGAGIANWISYYGQNGIDKWMIPFFGASAYDDPAIYRAASAIDAIKAAKTPTLIYVGERDVECPAAQSLEFWHGMRAVGAPSSLVIYDGEGHHFAKPEHIKDLRSRLLAWFDRYL